MIVNNQIINFIKKEMINQMDNKFPGKDISEEDHKD